MTSQARPRAAIFDVEGVIAFPDVPAADAGLARVSAALDLERLNAARRSPENYALWESYSVGALDSESYWASALRTAGVEDAPSRVAEVQEVMRATWWGVLDQAVIDFATRLRFAGLRTAVLSNSAPEHEARIPDIAPAFSYHHFSHRTGRRKPDPEAYLAVIDDLGVPPEQCLFIDDKPRNVAAAARLSLRALRFTSWSGLLDAVGASGDLDHPSDLSADTELE